jgi:hypothetical protein
VPEPGPPGGVKVGDGQLHPGLALGDEYRTRLAALQQPGQEPGRAGLPDDDVDGAALAAYLACLLGRSRSSTSSASTSAERADGLLEPRLSTRGRAAIVLHRPEGARPI